MDKLWKYWKNGLYVWNIFKFFFKNLILILESNKESLKGDL